MSGTTLRRVMKELKDLQKNPIKEFTLHTVEDSALVLHFTMMGPLDSPYQDGIYHGRILIPSEYPFAPPDVVMLTPSGRFEVGKKVCLSVSSYHPERWKATWGIATVIHALRDHMATSEKLGIGAVDYPNIIRVKMAGQSRDFVCKECGAVVASVWDNIMKDAPPATDVDVAAKMELLASPAQSPQSTPSGAAAASMEGRTPSGWEMLPAAEATAAAAATSSTAEPTTTDSPVVTNTTPTNNAADTLTTNTTPPPTAVVVSSSSSPLGGEQHATATTGGDTYPTDEVVVQQPPPSSLSVSPSSSSAAAAAGDTAGAATTTTTEGRTNEEVVVPRTSTVGKKTDTETTAAIENGERPANVVVVAEGAAGGEEEVAPAEPQPQPPVVVPAVVRHDRHMRVERRGRRVQVHLSISMIDAWIYRLVALIAIIVLKKLLLDHWVETARVGGVAWDFLNAW